jgi:hypothetical protein
MYASFLRDALVPPPIVEGVHGPKVAVAVSGGILSPAHQHTLKEKRRGEERGTHHIAMRCHGTL